MFQEDTLPLKEEAIRKSPVISVTLDVSHDDKSPLNDEIDVVLSSFANMKNIFDTLDVFQDDKLRLKDSAPKNISVIAVTLDVFHDETLPLNDLAR